MLKTGLQQLVLTANRVPFVLPLMRLPYYAAINACQRLMARHPAIQAAYARNSFALGTWVPGRSDIDITAIWKGCSPDEIPPGTTELDAIQAWWHDYAKLQRWYPMLGEVEMIHQNHLLASTRFGQTGDEARQWLPIYGSLAPESGYLGSEAQQRRDRFTYALSAYYHQLHGAVRSASKSTLRRYVKKIWRYLDLPMDEAMENNLRQSSAIEIQVLVIKALTQRAIREAPTLSVGKPVDMKKILQKEEINRIEHSSLPSNHPVLSVLEQPELAADLISIVPAANYPNKTYYMVKDDISDASLTAYLLSLQGKAEDAIVVPQSFFNCILYTVDIIEYLALVQHRTVLWGKDPFYAWSAITQSVLNVAVGVSAGYIFSLPYQPEFNTFSGPTFKDFLFGWILRIGRFLEDGVMDFDYERLEGYWVQKHPEDLISLDCVQLEAQERFDLLSRLNHRISKNLLNLN